LTQPAFPTAYVWTGMKSGKLDEELSRMSAIADTVKPTAGERLLQTVGHRIEDKVPSRACTPLRLDAGSTDEVACSMREMPDPANTNARASDCAGAPAKKNRRRKPMLRGLRAATLLTLKPELTRGTLPC